MSALTCKKTGIKGASLPDWLHNMQIEVLTLREQLKEANKVIEEQAIEIQKLNTENELLKSELNWESECKFAYKSKRDELKLDFDKLCIRYNEVHNYNREKRTLLEEAYQIIECLYNLDTLDSEIDKSWIDEAFRNASMFLQNNTEYKAV